MSFADKIIIKFVIAMCIFSVVILFVFIAVVVLDDSPDTEVVCDTTYKFGVFNLPYKGVVRMTETEYVRWCLDE